jgi:cyanophycinase-like exopeptidase
MARLLVIMGSGETAPTMIKPHRAIFERIGAGPAVMIDTPYGFQPNADDITNRAVTYFAASVGRPVQVASWRTGDVGGAARERSVAALREASWAFCGPGSPTYALRQWRDGPIPGLLVDTLRKPDAAVVFASAAALTLGSHSIPVYEIYKAGIDPSWTPGLDIVRSVTGLPAVVIPHYDNAEGGHHDTRFCYLGEGRLSFMESLLPDDAFILGVDEHTAVILDLDARTASVIGNATMTIRWGGHSIVHPSGDVVAFDELTAGVADAPMPVAGSLPVADATSAERPDGVTSLRTEEIRLSGAFDTAAGANDINACVETILELEQAIVDWAADTADDGTHERATLRQMVVRLGDMARGEQASDATIGPLLDVLMTARGRARAAKDFATSDAIRDRLAELDIEIQDTADGPRWHRR